MALIGIWTPLIRLTVEIKLRQRESAAKCRGVMMPIATSTTQGIKHKCVTEYICFTKIIWPQGLILVGLHQCSLLNKPENEFKFNSVCITKLIGGCKDWAQINLNQTSEEDSTINVLRSNFSAVKNELHSAFRSEMEF